MKVGWQIKRFDDVLEIRNGKNQREVESKDGEYPIFGSAGNVMGYATSYICEAGTTIIGRKGNINTPIFSETKFWNVDTAFGLAARPGLDSKFLYYYCLSFDFSVLNRGTTIPSLVKSELLGLSILLPALPEQQRIVGILDEAFDGIATAKAIAEKNLQNASALFESHLQSVFTERGEGWVESCKPLSDLCELIVDCEHKTAPTQDEGIPSIRTPNIGKGRLLLDGVYRVSEETYREWTRRAEPKAGDLILAREAPAGNVAVVPENIRVCLGQRTVLIRPKAMVFYPSFLAYLLLEPRTQARLLEHSRGATVQHVNMKDIRALDVGAIPNVGIQKSVVGMLTALESNVQRLESIYQRKLTALDSLKKSLLHQAFSGKL
jgi:type I restriction enzyme S subunit